MIAVATKVGLVICFLVAFNVLGSNSQIVELNSDNFAKKITESNSIWLVGFYDKQSEASLKFHNDFAALANILQGIVNVGSVEAANVDLIREHKIHNLNSRPTLKLFRDKISKEFKGEKTKNAVLEFVIGELESSVRKRGGLKKKSDKKSSSSSSDGSGPAVVELTDSNFAKTVLDSTELWLVEFFAPWCGHCKNLKPHWDEAGRRLRGKINLGALDATVHSATANKYDIRGYPTIKLFRGGVAEEYTGGRTADEIEAWALNVLSSATPVVVNQITDSESFDTDCRTSHKLCVVAVLPHLLDCQSACRNQYLDLLLKMAKKRRRDNWGWVWTEAGAQPELESALNIGGFGYPALAVTHFEKQKYTLLKGSFSESGLGDFFSQIVGGRVSTDTLSKTIAIRSVDEWDGNDAVVDESVTGHEEL